MYLKRNIASWLIIFTVLLLVASCGGSPSSSSGPANEGSDTNPLNLGTISSTLTRTSSVASYGTSFYKFTTGSVAGSYTIGLTNTKSELSWVLVDSSLTLVDFCFGATAGAADVSCSTSLAANATYYLVVEEYDYKAQTFTLTITPPAVPVSEGSETSPLNLGVISSTLTRNSSVGSYGTSYYSFTSGATAGSYTIGLTNTKSTLTWDLMTSTALIRTCSSGTTGAANVTCTATLAANTTYYLIVDEWDSVAQNFTLSITPPTPPATPTGLTATAGYGQISLYWTAVSGATSYNVYWSVDSTNWTKVSGITTASYMHTGLTQGTTYYYSVTASNSSAESAASSVVSKTPLTAYVSYTFDDGTMQGWTSSVSGTWGVTSTYSKSPSYSITDSPSGNYADYANTSLISPVIDLTATTAPTLKFWHRYSLENSFDYGYVEISTNGGTTYTNITPNTSQRYTGALSTFTSVSIDLSSYKSSSQVRIRFRLTSDFVSNYNGWYIDDIVITQ